MKKILGNISIEEIISELLDRGREIEIYMRDGEVVTEAKKTRQPTRGGIYQEPMQAKKYRDKEAKKRQRKF